jgi:hypothetical protein
VHNQGPVTLRLHKVTDSKLGLIKDNLSLVLLPDASVHFTTTTPITQTTTNVFTWTGYITNTDGISTLATATATVHTPAIKVHATVGTDPNACATTNTITVTAGTVVDFCYSVVNTGAVTLTHHEISDNASIAYYSRTQPLLPGSSYAIGVATPVTQTLVNKVNWVAYGDNPLSATKPLSAADSSQITVTVLYTLGVFLFYDVDANGNLNDLERGWSGAVIHLQPTSGSLLTATTDIDGHVIFTSVHAGPYTLSVDTHSMPNGFRTTTRNIPYMQTMQWNHPPFVIFGYTASPTFNSDCDPLPDQLEGARDSDGDGIPDYLDGNCLYFPLVRR